MLQFGFLVVILYRSLWKCFIINFSWLKSCSWNMMHLSEDMSAWLAAVLFCFCIRIFDSWLRFVWFAHPTVFGLQKRSKRSAQKCAPKRKDFRVTYRTISRFYYYPTQPITCQLQINFRQPFLRLDKLCHTRVSCCIAWSSLRQSQGHDCKIRMPKQKENTKK